MVDPLNLIKWKVLRFRVARWEGRSVTCRISGIFSTGVGSEWWVRWVVWGGWRVISIFGGVWRFFVNASRTAPGTSCSMVRTFTPRTIIWPIRCSFSSKFRQYCKLFSVVIEYGRVPIFSSQARSEAIQEWGVLMVGVVGMTVKGGYGYGAFCWREGSGLERKENVYRGLVEIWMFFLKVC